MVATRRQKQQQTATDPSPATQTDKGRRKTTTRTRTKSQTAATAEPASSDPPSEEPAPSSDFTHDGTESAENEATREDEGEAQSSLYLMNLDSDQPEHECNGDDEGSDALQGQQGSSDNEVAEAVPEMPMTDVQDDSEAALPVPVELELSLTVDAVGDEPNSHEEEAAVSVVDDTTSAVEPSTNVDIAANASQEVVSPENTTQSAVSSDTNSTSTGMLIDLDESLRMPTRDTSSHEQVHETAQAPVTDDLHIDHANAPTSDISVPLISLDSSPVKKIPTPSLVPFGRKNEELVHRDAKISNLQAQLKKREIEVRRTRTYLQRFAETLESSLKSKAQTGRTVGRASLGFNTSIGNSTIYPDEEESVLMGDSSVCSVGSPTVEVETNQYLLDDVDNLRVLWAEATQHFDFMRVEDHVLIQRLARDLETAQSMQSEVEAPADDGSAEKLEKMQGELEETRRKASEMAEDYAKRLQSQQAAMDELKGSFESSQNEADTLRSKLAAAEELKRSFEVRQQEVDALRAKVAAAEDLRDSFEGRQNEADKLRTQLAATEGQLEQAKKEQERLLDEERTASGMLLQATSKELDKLKDRNVQLERALNQAQVDAAQAAELRKELDTAGEKEVLVQQLQEELEAAEEQIKVLGDEKEQESSRLTEERTSFEGQLKAASAHQDELSAQLLTLGQELESARAELVSARQGQDQLELVRKELDQARQGGAELEQLQKELEDARRAEEELEHVRKELESARRGEVVIQQLQEELASQKELARELEAAREKQAQLLAQERSSSARMLQDADAERDGLTSRIANLEEALQKAQAQTAIVSELQQQVERSQQTTTAQVHEQVERLRQEQVKVQDLEEELRHKEVELLRLRTQVVSNDELIKQAREETDRINERLQAGKHERDVLHRQLADMETQVSQSSKTSAVSKETLDQLHRRIRELERSLEGVEDLKAQFAQLEEELARKAAEIEENDTKMINSHKERKRLEARCKKLQTKIDQMTVAGPTSSSSAPDAVRSTTTSAPPAVPARLIQAFSSESGHSSPSPAARSPLTVSRTANVPLMARGEVKPMRVVETMSSSHAGVHMTSSSKAATSAPSPVLVREEKAPTPWSMAVAISNNQAARSVPSEANAVKPARSAHAAVVTSRPIIAPAEKSRKRSSPDDEAELAHGSGTSSAGRGMGVSAPVTRAIFVPSPGRSSAFVPQRRSKTDLGASVKETARSASSSSSSSAAFETAAPSTAAAGAAGSIRLVSTSTKLSAAERLKGRLAGGGMHDGPLVARVGDGGRTKLSAQLAEARARREMARP
ncbi:unnamed protein product [Tilletia controversa]|nr:unnamed protein product [Tilletia controversa]